MDVPSHILRAAAQSISAYRAWLDDRIERQRAQVRALDRVCAICKPVWDEDSSVPIDEALQVMADRGSEAAQRELASWGA